MRLIDCFMELVTFTAYFIESLKTCQPPYEDIQKQYRQFFARAEAKRRGSGFSAEEWESALFAICAWIDESILCSSWSEKEKWAQSPLQRVHFNTFSAGNEFFVRLDDLKRDAGQVREVYAYCLALGFRGRYFPTEDEGKLGEIRNANLDFLIEGARPVIPEILFPGAYSISHKPGKGKKWLRLISPARLPFIILPMVAFVALFFLYKYILEKMIANFF